MQAEAAAAALTSMRLPGPTGESDTLALRPRERIACVASTSVDLVHQVVAATRSASRRSPRRRRCPAALRGFVGDWDGDVRRIADLDALLVALPAAERARTRAACATVPGALVAVIAWNRDTPPVLHSWRLMREFAESVNTAAAGGNASLMTLEDA